MEKPPTPLRLILPPPLAACAGQACTLSVSVFNDGERRADIDISVNGAKVRSWCDRPDRHLTLDPGQMATVDFHFEIPLQALVGPYNLEVVVSAPMYDPEVTPIKSVSRLSIVGPATCIPETHETYGGGETDGGRGAAPPGSAGGPGEWDGRRGASGEPEEPDWVQRVPASRPPKESGREGKQQLPPLPPREKTKPTAGRLLRVWYGTSRRLLDPADTSRGFDDDWDPNGVVRYGYCDVDIPKTHLFGSVGTPLWKRWLTLRFSDDTLRIVGRCGFIGEGDYLEALNRHIADCPEPQLLVYLHGYNVSFDEAAVRAAQIGCDLKVPGAMAFFSWPSLARTDSYFKDADRVAASEKHIAQFLTLVSKNVGAKRVHIIAHSMGNRGLARAIQRITAEVSTGTGVRFGQIILAAPDMEVNLFRELASVYPQISERTTLYVSRKDRALHLSQWLQDSHRAGFCPPVTVVPGIDTVEVTNIDLTALGHGYFAEAAAVLYDMFDLLHNPKPPAQRQRISGVPDAKQAEYWVLDP